MPRQMRLLCRTVSRPCRPCVERPCSPEVQRPAGTSAVAWRVLAAARSCMDRGRTSPPQRFCADRNWQLREQALSSRIWRSGAGSCLANYAKRLRDGADVVSGSSKARLTDHRRAREGEARRQRSVGMGRYVCAPVSGDCTPIRRQALAGCARENHAAQRVKCVSAQRTIRRAI